MGGSGVGVHHLQVGVAAHALPVGVPIADEHLLLLEDLGGPVGRWLDALHHQRWRQYFDMRLHTRHIRTADTPIEHRRHRQLIITFHKIPVRRGLHSILLTLIDQPYRHPLRLLPQPRPPRLNPREPHLRYHIIEHFLTSFVGGESHFFR